MNFLKFGLKYGAHDEIAKNLFNQNITPLGSETNINNLMKQYQLLIESSGRSEERRKDANNVFIAIHSVLVSFVTQSKLVNIDNLYDLKLINILTMLLLSAIGFILCWDWSDVIKSYRKINNTNFTLINVMESFMPSYLFSLKGELEGGGVANKKTNLILEKEKILPKIFALVYIVIFLLGIILLIDKIIGKNLF